MLARFGRWALAGVTGALLAAPASAQNSDEPLPRFEEPICPGVAGMKVEDAEVMVGRIRTNLASFGRRLAPEKDCEANLIVAFVRDGKAYVENLKRTDRWLFDEMPRRERERLLAETGPARAVVRVRAKSRDGMPVGERQNLQEIPQSIGWMAHSKIYTATRNDITSALVLIDSAASRDLTILQLADYATFRALTSVVPETAEARGASIVSLFDGGATRPSQLTEFDLAYLRELYSGIPNIPGPMRQMALEAATGVDIFRQ